jgi:hypothetical protein
MAEKKQLATHLKADYKIEAGGKVVSKSGLKVKIKEKNVELKDPDIWILAHTSKSNRDMYVKCTKIITHAAVLRLKREHSIKFTDYDWKKEPNNPELWGYLLVTTECGTVGDGEVHAKTLSLNMRTFAYTMLKKRAEDRAVLQALGLYGLVYSESEVTPDMKEDFEETPEPKDVKGTLLTKIAKASEYLGPSINLIELVAGLTGEEAGKIELDNMSPDILAKISNHLNQLSREELALRKTHLVEFLRLHPNTKKTEEDILGAHSSVLKETIDKKKAKINGNGKGSQ